MKENIDPKKTEWEGHRRFREMGEALGATPKAEGWFSVTINGQEFSSAFEELISTESYTSFWSISISLDEIHRDPYEVAGAYRQGARRTVEGQPTLELRRKTWRDQAGKRLQINREVQTGDAVFDPKVYIETEAPEAAPAILHDERARRGVLAVIDLGFKVMINAGGGRLTALWVNPPTERFDPAVLRAVCEGLNLLGTGLPHFHGPPYPRPSNRVAVALVVIAGALAMAAFFTCWFARSHWFPLTPTAPNLGALVGLGVAAFMLPLIALLVRGRSNSFRYFLISGSLLLGSMPFNGIAVAIGVNGALDEGAPVEHVLHIKSKYALETSGEYHVQTTDWRAEASTIELSVDEDFYNLVKRGDPVLVKVGPGRLGWPWFIGIQCLSLEDKRTIQ
jgi:hypothetical protein